MSSEISLEARSIGKFFPIYDKPRDRLLQMLVGKRRKLFREHWALQDVSFEVHRGETVGIIGRNGSGKSTLLQLICGTLTPSLGEIGKRGRIAALLELGAGFNAEFTGRENVFLYAALYGLNHAQTEERLPQMLSFADIGDFIDQPVKTYSSGMYVRLAFAVIAHIDADVLIIDEALAVGDAFFVQKCMRFLRQFQESGTVVMVSHDSAAIVNLCDRAIWLDEGRVRMNGPAKAVSEAYLASLYEASGAVSKPRVTNPSPAVAVSAPPPANRPPVSNSIEVLRFDPDSAGFGTGGASLEQVELKTPNGDAQGWVEGGESVSLTVTVQANAPIESAVIGFIVKDRLGQSLFGENTYARFRHDKVQLAPGEVASVRFDFRMPIMPQGAYTVDIAVADGTHDQHVQLLWLHDAMVFHSHTSSTSTGLVGVPMDAIELVTE